jgi:hypothetical protein
MRNKIVLFGILVLFVVLAVAPVSAQQSWTDTNGVIWSDPIEVSTVDDEENIMSGQLVKLPIRKIVDQSHLNSDGVGTINVALPRGQEFKPMMDKLVGIDIWLTTLNPQSGDDIITVTIRENSINGPIVVPPQAQSVPAGSHGLVHFNFQETQVVPESVYVIEVAATKNTFGWPCYDSTDGVSYDRGRAIVSGEPIPFRDYVFQTYAPAPVDVWEYVVTSHRERQVGDAFIGDSFIFPFPPWCPGPVEIGIHQRFSTRLIDMEDFDNDGDFDFLVMEVYPTPTAVDAYFFLFIHDGNLNFDKKQVGRVEGLPSEWESGNIGLAAADFTGDGYPDFVATIPQDGEYNDQIYVFVNNGDNTFTQASIFIAAWARHAKEMDAGDFDEDGNYDFVIFDYPWGGAQIPGREFNVYLYQGTGSGTFTPQYLFTPPNSIGMIVAGDFGGYGGLGTPADGHLDILVGQDDDGDPGQTWIYFGDGNGNFNGPYEAYDLNPEPPGSDQPGAGNADAYDLDDDDNLDIVATGSTSDPLISILYFVKGNGDGTFQDPQVKYGGDMKGVGSAVAAPPVWFGAKFIAHFMTPEGEPYPFDVIISDGIWRQEFKNVTDIETEVPCDATYTCVYRRGGWEFNRNFNITLQPGEVREFEFYAHNLLQIEVRTRPYIFFQEVGADASLYWEWNPETGNLTWTLSGEPEKYVSLMLGIDDDASEPPNYALKVHQPGPDGPVAQCLQARTHWEYIPGVGVPCIRMPIHCVDYWYFYSNVTGYSIFKEIDPGLGTIRIGYGLYNDAIVVYPINTTLRNLNGTVLEKEFVDPQYAVPPGNYLMDGEEILPGFTLRTPLQIKAGKGTNIDNIYITKITDLSDFTFAIIAESAFSHSSYSNLVHDERNKMLSVNVSTETDYDWWGYFVLPETYQVESILACDCEGVCDELSELVDYTVNPIDGYNIVVVRIGPETERLMLEYEYPVEVPALTPIGLIVLIGLLSVIVVSKIKRKEK